MKGETYTVENVYSSIFESALVKELAEKSMVITANAGQQLINMGQTIKMVPMVLSGTLKVSRENEEGQELLLYYVKPGEGCAITRRISINDNTACPHLKPVHNKPSHNLHYPIFGSKTHFWKNQR